MSNARELAQAPNQPGRKNLFFNGDMKIWQRSTSTQYVSGVQNAYLTADRWRTTRSSQATVTQALADDGPTGIRYSLGLTVDVADATLDAGNYEYISQRLEGWDIQHLNWGTADAKPVTVSFWVKCSETGDFSASLFVYTAGAAASYNIGTVVTINAADTWEYKTLTFPGFETTTIAGNNEIALMFAFFTTAGSNFTTTDNSSWDTYTSGRLAYGQTLNLNGTLNATFRITGLQLEVGEVATEFEHISVAEEQSRCERYYQYSHTRTIGGGEVNAGGYYEFDSVYLRTFMRGTPTITPIYVGSARFAAAVPTIATITVNSFGAYAAPTSTGYGYLQYRFTAEAEI